MTAEYKADTTWNQWSTAYVGGGEYPVYLTVHLPCGAYVADGERHARVCTAPPWEPTPVNNGETQDFYADGHIEKRTP